MTEKFLYIGELSGRFGQLKTFTAGGTIVKGDPVTFDGANETVVALAGATGVEIMIGVAQESAVVTESVLVRPCTSGSLWAVKPEDTDVKNGVAYGLNSYANSLTIDADNTTQVRVVPLEDITIDGEARHVCVIHKTYSLF